MNNRKTQFTIIGLLTIFVITLVYSQLTETAPQVSQPVAETSVTTEKIEKNTDVLTVEVTYPTVPTVPGVTQEIKQTNESLKKLVDEKIAEFEKEAVDNTNAELEIPKEVHSTITGGPSVEEQNDRYVSIFMGMEWYLRGAAHPSHTIDTYIYDYKNKTLLKVSDLFKQGSNYLTVLSGLSKEDLLSQSKQGDMGYVYNEEMVSDGTVPSVDNFSRILPTKDGLVVYFNEYQVAPYAAGPQQVVIPYSKLKDIIATEGVLSLYLK